MNSFNEINLDIEDSKFLRRRFCSTPYILSLNMLLAELIFFGLICFFVFILNLTSGEAIDLEFIVSIIITPVLLALACWLIITVLPKVFISLIVNSIINAGKKYSIIGSPTNYDKEAKLLDETDPYGQQFMKFKVDNKTYKFQINEHSDELKYIQQGGKFKIDFVSKIFIFQELSRTRISE